MSFEVGTAFARDYKIVSRLGAGGMGAVYVVEQISTGKKRALKVMLPALVDSPTQRKRFEQEARVGALIESEHVVEVHAAGVEDDTPWLAMELLKGETLDERVERGGPLSPKAVADVFRQLSHAVGAAHRAGIVHRDLKPENIFVAKTGFYGEQEIVKVLDFGIAKLTMEAGAKTTDAMGSPLWMAPEQTEREGVDARADVWAMGLIAYFLLTGRTFWRVGNGPGGSVGQVLREILFEPIPNANERAKEQGCSLPSTFADWFARCVVRDPSARFPTAAEAWKDVKPRLGDDAVVKNKAIVPAAVSAFDKTVEALPLATTAPFVASEAAENPSARSPSKRGPLLGVGIVALAVTAGLVALRYAREPSPAISPAPTAAASVVDAAVQLVAVAATAASIDSQKDGSAVALSDAGGTSPITSAVASSFASAQPGGKSPAMVRLSTRGSPAAKKILLASVPRLEACFRKSRSASDGKGIVEITLAIDENGKPSNVTATGAINNDAGDVMPCFEGVMRSLTFTPEPAQTEVSCTAMLLPEGSLYGGN